MDIYTFTLDSLLRPRKVSYAVGLVTDSQTGKEVSARVEVYNLEDSTDTYTFFTDKNGVFKISLVHGEDYGIHVRSDGYVFYSDRFSLSETEPYARYELFVSLEPLKGISATGNSAPIVLNNIQFAFGDSMLLESSIPELRLVRDLLESRTDISIRVDGHTDNIGSEEDNLKLSEARARAVLEWLVNNGISRGRLSYKGYGESVPVASNDTAEGRRKNRRTELVIQ